MLLSFFVFL